MRDQIRIFLSAFTLAAIVFSFGCKTTTQEPPGTGTATPSASPTTPDVQPPGACTVDALEKWIATRINDNGGPLKAQYDAKKFSISAEEVTVKTKSEDGKEEQTGTYAQVTVSGALSGDGTLDLLNGIIKPLIKRPDANQGPCVTSVKYVTPSTTDAPTTDFIWSYCPVGSQVCSDGTCSQYCTGRTGGITKD